MGLTAYLPENDVQSYDREFLMNRITIAMGGRAAEELIFNELTTGASNDIQQATNIARRMVTEFGFSAKLGPLRYSDNEEEVFLGHSVARQKHVSDATAAIIDQEVRDLIDEAETNARRILSENRDDLEVIAQGLLEYETLSGNDVDALLRGEEIVRKDDDYTTPVGGSKASVPSSAPAKKDKGSSDIGDIEPQPES